MKKMEVPRRTFLHLAAVAAALPAASPGWAQTYPSRPITIVIAFPPEDQRTLLDVFSVRECGRH